MQKSAKLAIFGWSTVFPPGCFIMYIFLPTIWWSFVLFRKMHRCCNFLTSYGAEDNKNDGNEVLDDNGTV